MASTSHHSEEAPHPRNGNGFDPLLEWFGVPPDAHTFYAVLGIDPGETDGPTIEAAAKDRLEYLKRHLNGSHADAAQRVRKIVEDAQTCLLDPKKRRAYNEKIRHKRPELLVSHTTHDIIADVVPAAVSRTEAPPQSLLSRMGAGMNRKHWIAVTAAGVLGGVAALFGLSKNGETPPEQPAAPAELNLAENAPELNRSPVTPPAVPPTTVATPPEPPTPKPSAPTTPAVAEAPVNPPPPAVPQERETTAPAAPAAAAETVEQPAIAERAAPARSDAPTQEDLESYRNLLQSPTLAKQTVQQLIEQARQSSKPVEQWILLDIALRKARAERDLSQMMAVLAEKKMHFAVDDLVMEESMEAVRKASMQKGGNVAPVMTGASSVIRGLCARDAFDEAKKFIAAMKDRPSAHRKECLDILRVVSQLQKAYDEANIAEHQKTLAEHPDDAGANRTVGLYRCFKEGDWSYTSALQASNDPALRSLGQRVDRRESLSAAELLQLAKDITATETGPGAVAMAMQCLELAAPKADTMILTAGIHDLLQELAKSHPSVPPFFRGSLQTNAVATATQTPDNIHTSAPDVLPPGTVDLVGADAAALLKSGKVIRPEWGVTKDGKLQSTSGHRTWVSSMNYVAPSEAIKVIQSGQYRLRVTFSYSADGRREGETRGPVAIVFPLPNGENITLYWGANMHDDLWRNGAGFYRSGFDTSSAPLLCGPNPPPSTATLTHRQPIVVDDGRKYVCDIVVRTVSNGYAITAGIAEPHQKTLLAAVSLAAPPTVKGGSYLLTNDPKNLPAQSGLIGYGTGGGTLVIESSTMSPLQPERPSRSR
ncbi:MAG: hypothetical protein PHZ00_05685 [Candidatus Peribacteraceae bacterium]|nr:hypothetical protein [Candidatus Peribacteraceae bacterium]